MRPSTWFSVGPRSRSIILDHTGGAQSAGWFAVSVHPRSEIDHRLGKRIPGGDRRGGTLRGHGPFWEGTDPARLEFFRMAPNWAMWMLVVLATAATVIASQVLISGAYSQTLQAIQMGYLPRIQVMEIPTIEKIAEAAAAQDFELLPNRTTFFLGRETLVPANGKALSRLRRTVFRLMSRNAENAADFFQLPSDRTVEIGFPVEL
jgi:K+ transporter